MWFKRIIHCVLFLLGEKYHGSVSNRVSHNAICGEGSSYSINLLHTAVAAS